MTKTLAETPSTRPQAGGGIFPSPNHRTLYVEYIQNGMMAGAATLCPNKNEEAEHQPPPQPQRDSRRARMEEEQSVAFTPVDST